MSELEMLDLIGRGVWVLVVFSAARLAFEIYDRLSSR